MSQRSIYVTCRNCGQEYLVNPPETPRCPFCGESGSILEKVLKKIILKKRR